jgi:hypothetical protein
MTGPVLWFTPVPRGPAGRRGHARSPAYPPQSFVRLRLSRPESLSITAFDISPRVLDHRERARKRAAAGEGYVLQLPRPREGWAAPFVAYWQRFGDAVSGPADAAKPPPSAGPLEVRAIRYETVVFSDRPDDGEHVIFYRRLPDLPREVSAP